MRKVLYLIVTSLLLTTCSGQGETPPSSPLAEARATAAVDADGGEEPLVVFQRAPEGAESLEEYRFYAGGRAAIITAASGGVEVSEAQLEAETVDALLQNLEGADFFETADAGEQQWTDTIDYLITASRDGEVRSLAIDEVTSQTSVKRMQSLVVLERFVFLQVK